MTRQEFDRFVDAIDGALDRLQMTWEGPEPHDFRNMKERGVRFVHSGLYVKGWSPGFGIAEPSDYAPDGVVHFRILAGDREVGDKLMASIRALGFKPRFVERSAEMLIDTVFFDVPVGSFKQKALLSESCELASADGSPLPSER